MQEYYIEYNPQLFIFLYKFEHHEIYRYNT
jgi:hypothetical protein